MEYKTISIREMLEDINKKMVYLPAIQRSFVWDDSEIIKLFESIYMEYPIGTLLFWKIDIKNINKHNLELYEIKSNYNYECSYNEDPIKKITTDYENYYIVLDGQQRLTALLIGFLGTFNIKKPRAWSSNLNAFEKRSLYFNLDFDYKEDFTFEDDEDDVKKTPIFKFIKFDNSNEINIDVDINNNHKYKFLLCSKFFDFNNEQDIIEFSHNNSLNEKQENNILRFYNLFATDKIPFIHFLTIENANYNDVLNIFIRLNSTGKLLAKSDLLFSTLVLHWDDGRKEINELLRSINYNHTFDFSKNFIIRTLLVLSDKSVNMKVESLNDSIDIIHENFNDMKKAILDAVKALKKLGYSDKTLISQNALIPYIYYLYKGGSNTSKSIKGLKKYLAISLLNGIYGVASNSALTNTRTALQKIDCSKVFFNVSLFKDVHLTGNRHFKITPKDIDDFMNIQKGNLTLILLTLLYPDIKINSVEYEQDHVHPLFCFNNLNEYKLSSKTIEEWNILKNTLPNLELLDKTENQEKSKKTLTDWLKEDKTRKIEYSSCSESTDMKNFKNYYIARKKKMIKKLKDIFRD